MQAGSGCRGFYEEKGEVQESPHNISMRWQQKVKKRDREETLRKG